MATAAHARPTRRQFDPRWLTLAVTTIGGFMTLLRVPDDFMHRIMNVHPSLVPSFCGKGMFGHRVHEAVIEYGVRLSGVTVHFVDNEYPRVFGDLT